MKSRPKQDILKIFTICCLFLAILTIPMFPAEEGVVQPADDDGKKTEASSTPVNPVLVLAETAGSGSPQFTLKSFEPRLQLSPEASRFYQQLEKQGKFENTFFKTSLVSLLALNVADYISTRQALKHEGLCEGNPLMKPFVKNDLAFAAVKLGVSLGNHFLLNRLYKQNKPLAWALSIVSNLALSYVVAHNFKMIDRVRGF